MLCINLGSGWTWPWPLTSFPLKLCLELIYIIWLRITNLVSRWFLGWRNASYNLRSLWPWPHFYNTCVRSIALTLFEVGIPSLVCISGWRSFKYHFGFTVTLTSDHVYKKSCVSSISPILFELGIQIWCVNVSWAGGVSHTLFRSLYLWPHFLNNHVHNIPPGESQIRCKDASWDWRVSCTIFFGQFDLGLDLWPG